MWCWAILGGCPQLLQSSFNWISECNRLLWTPPPFVSSILNLQLHHFIRSQGPFTKHLKAHPKEYLNKSIDSLLLRSLIITLFQFFIHIKFISRFFFVRYTNSENFRLHHNLFFLKESKKSWRNFSIKLDEFFMVNRYVILLLFCLSEWLMKFFCSWGRSFL